MISAGGRIGDIGAPNGGAPAVDPLTDCARRADRPNLVFATLAINLLSLALPIMTLQVYDRILPNPGTGTLAAFVVGVAIALILEAALRAARAHVVDWNAAAFEHKASCLALGRIVGAELSRRDGRAARGVGEELQNFAAISKLKELYADGALTTLIELGFVIGFLALVGYLAGWLVLAPLTVLAVFVIHAALSGETLKAKLVEREENDNRRYDFLLETWKGVHAVKAFALEGTLERRYERLEERSSAANLEVTEAAAHAFNIGMVFSNLMIVTVIVIGAYLTLDGMITSGALVACVLISGRMMQPVQRGLALWARYQDIALARARIREIIEAPQAPRVARAPAAGRPAAESETDTRQTADTTLEARGVAFTPAGAEAPIVENMNLALAPGGSLAILGAPGSGTGAARSAVIKLLAGLYGPDAGEVLLDGVRIDALPDAERAARIALLPSQAVLFRGTVRDNLTRFGLTKDKDARAAAALLGLDRDIAKLPSGYDTRLEGGPLDPLAPGLRQRIAIARALAPRPRFVLFDHADKDLDRNGYALLFDVLARLKSEVGLIIASDDENMISLADTRLRLAARRLAPEPATRARAGHSKRTPA